MRMLFLFLASCLLMAPLASARTLLVLPVTGETENPSDLAAVNRLFREAVLHRHAGEAVAPPAPADCGDRECARATAARLQADEVIYSSLYRLGARWIFSATRMNTDGTEAFSQRLTAGTIEDMEAVAQRMADALILRKSLEQVATLDNITAKEQDQEPERRRSLYNGGVALGYLFPVGNSFSYLEDDYDSGDPVRREYDQMIRLTWLNTWEFRNDLNLGADVTWSTPYAIGADLNLRYLFNRGDFSPFLGGGIGLHYVKSDEDGYGGDNKRNSGPALNVQGGVMLFRTYDVNVMLRGQYQVVFNSDMDHGPAVDVGVSFRPKEEKGGGKSDSNLGSWGAVGLTLALLMVLGAFGS